MMADYRQRWLECKRLRNQAVIATLSIFPLALVFRLIGALISNPLLAQYLDAAFGVGWLIAAYVTGARVGIFLCPRCGKRFASKWWYGGGMPFARRCAHCGLPKYANDDSPKS
jgi:hypothetical protein